MSLLKAIKVQLGLSNTATNNFTWTAENADGTAKLARGNAGATTQDVMTVDAAGKVVFPQNVQTWQNMLASRAIDGTVYTNGTVQPITVKVTSIGSTFAVLTHAIAISGSVIGVDSAYANGAGYRVSSTFTVPAGATYTVTGGASAGTLTKEYWMELR